MLVDQEQKVQNFIRITNNGGQYCAPVLLFVINTSMGYENAINKKD